MENNKTIGLSIIMPAYNEESNIETTIRAAHKVLAGMGVEGEIVVTNDGSRDRTQELLERLSGDYPNLVVVNHQKNLGYGAALKSAVQASKGEYVATIDSDGQFDISELPTFFAPHPNGNAVVTGYRKKKQDTAFRVAANRGLNMFITVLFGARLTDINCAFRVYRGDALRSINIESRGYQAPSEIILKMMMLGAGVKEVAVSHYARSGGQSKLRPFRTIAQMSAFLIYLKMKTVLFRKGMLNAL